MSSEPRNTNADADTNPPPSTSTSAMANGSLRASGAADATGAGGANPSLLISMMNCVDTSLFSPQQLHNWEQTKQRLKAAAEQNVPVSLPMSMSDLTGNAARWASSERNGGAEQGEFRQQLHREASIQDVLSCLLEQQAPSLRVMNSNGSNVLLNSELKNRHANTANGPSSSGGSDQRPTLKSILSSNNFSMTEKKESLRHLLSFIDNSFASNPEPMTDVYKENKEGSLQRLSSLQLMRSFMVPNSNAQSMGRTTSFEIIQAMLNATSNQVIQKPMTSQDSFRFQHLANCLESIEGDVGYDNEDYGGEEVVQVDNLDNLLDYHGPAASQTSAASTSQTPAAPVSQNGFVDTQSLFNQASRMPTSQTGSFAPPPFPSSQPSSMNGYQPMYMGQQTQMQQYAPMSQHGMDLLGEMATHSAPPHMLGGYPSTAAPIKNESLQSQVGLQPGMLPAPQSYGQLSYQSAVMATSGAGMMMPMTHSYPQHAYTPDAMMKHQQLSAILQQQQHQQHLNASAQVKQLKQDAQGGVQICSALGCNHVARVKGMCKLHGGGRRCKVDGCMKSAQTGHLCIAHGGGKPCNVEGCPKTAQSRGLCKQHGGGVRCKFEGCTKSCQSGGFCRGHGGGKRCEFPNCTKWAQKNGHCAKHAQEVAQHLHG
ncbi:hypothetical protein P43SY_009926 [Pythium insidiosum]|uniref:WRKY19-like zinc finger domain-containing protein n=1 Tax=Pythium insidiosum TaxID=114742 RepID=A0AAD5M0P7_PYTIN|nr:hypothetical protein P43SY_009926 [Pythium insidiosum]